MKLVVYTCDHCDLQVQETGIIQSVEVSFGGVGAARDKIDGLDLCRGCFSRLVGEIRTFGTKMVREAVHP